MGKVSHHYFYKLNEQVLQSVSSAKYLGITITSDLGWSQHVASTASKAHQRLGFLKRNLRGAPYKCRETAYITLIRSQMEYCSSVWDPKFKKDSDSLERIQRKAARWSRCIPPYGEYKVTSLLKDLKWEPLAGRRRTQRLTLLYKILNDKVRIKPDTIDIHQNLNSRPRGNSNPKPLIRPSAKGRSSPLWDSTVFRSIPEWNRLPANVAEAGSVEAFKSQLASWSP